MLAEALMMVARVAGIALVLVWVVSRGAARNNESNKPPEARGENESVVITATAYTKPEAVKDCSVRTWAGIISWSRWKWRRALARRSPSTATISYRSEERRVGKECRSRWSPY